MLLSIILAISMSISSGWKTAEILPWYGYGFYGNRTACGQKMTKSLVGVAHRTLKCGTKIKIVWKGRTLVTRVVDRGPYPHRSLYDEMPLDLTAGAAKALGCDCKNPYFTRHNAKWKVIG